MKQVFTLIGMLLLLSSTFSQTPKRYQPTLQKCDCLFPIDSSFLAIAPTMVQQRLAFPKNGIDSSFKTECGYLVVPENRNKPGSGMIRLPYILLRSKNPNKKKDPVLFTSGGPGNSSLSWITGMTKSSIIQDRDCIAFEQRGTRYAIPYLRVFELDSAIKKSYRENLNKDSMWIEGVKRYKKALEKNGVDLAGYNSDETASDIQDLLKALKIDSVNLMGGSYSGGLMMAVLQKDPTRIRSLVLDSPLPMFSAIDEDEPVHFIEAIKKLSEHAASDSMDKSRYANLYQKFNDYFNSIILRTFTLTYQDASGRSLEIQYTKNDLLDIIESAMLNSSNLKEAPFIITEIMAGNHEQFIKPRIDRILNGYPAPDGMRMLVYCADQAAYHHESTIQQLYQLYPFMKGYHINDVWKAVCDCWNNPPVNPEIKLPFYSATPALIGDGEMDPGCSPLYMSEIKHYLINAQAFLFINRSHGVGGKDWYEMTQRFLDHPYQKVVPPNPAIMDHAIR